MAARWRPTSGFAIRSVTRTASAGPTRHATARVRSRQTATRAASSAPTTRARSEPASAMSR